MESQALEIIEVAAQYVARDDLQEFQLQYLVEILLTDENDSARIIELWEASKLTY